MNSGFAHIALVLLAAGQSRRFGSPKLRALLRGKALAHHAAETLALLPFMARYAVTAHDDLGLEALGFTIVRSDSAEQSASLGAGVFAARQLQPYGIMVALADMPFVHRTHFQQLVEEFDGDRIASSNGLHRMPPAIFGRAHYDTLSRCSGDNGARNLLAGAHLVVADACQLQDIDTPEQLEAANVSHRF